MTTDKPDTSEKALWALGAPGLPFGAKRVGDTGPIPPKTTKLWLDVCLLGQHIPQIYEIREIHEFTKEEAPGLGLCPDCLGFGDLDTTVRETFVQVTRFLYEITNPCATCSGTGRVALRIAMDRDPVTRTTTSHLTILPHAYVPPLTGHWYAQNMELFEAPPDMCLACGSAKNLRNGKDGEPLHVGEDISREGK